MVLVNELIERLNKLDGTREIRFLDVANGDCDDEPRRTCNGTGLGDVDE